jgi:hypothetical protein
MMKRRPKPRLRSIPGGKTSASTAVAVEFKESGIDSFLLDAYSPDLAALEPTVVSSGNAILPVLPSPLVLKHGPLLVTVESWSDGTVVARLPCAALHGDGESDTAAIEDLAASIYDFIVSTSELVLRPRRDDSVVAKHSSRV